MGCVPVDQLLPLTIWSNGSVKHRISCIGITPNHKHLITGSWDGNLFIWTLDLKTHSLRSRWIVSGQGSGVSAITCFNSFFVAFLQDGSTCHFQLPTGYLLTRREDPSYVHTSAVAVEDGRIICAGFYPDLLVVDAYTLEIIAMLMSRVQSDWVSCLRTIVREDSVHVQGLTVSGVLKTWSLNDISGEVGLEMSSSPLGVPHCIGIAFDMKRRYLLLVTYTQITVFDFSVSIIFNHDSKQALEGGDFLGTGIVFWTKRGDLYYCDISSSNEVIRLIKMEGFEAHVPNNSLVHASGNLFYIVSDISGCLSVWRIQKEPSVSAHFVCSVDSSKASADSNGLLDYLNVRVTCSVHVTNLNKFVAGCSDGTLLMFQATDLIISHFFLDSHPDYSLFLGHRESVNCVIYPHSEQPAFSESLLVSGSNDYSVCIWDIFKKDLLHRFCVHSGPVVQLMIPPAECHARISNSICSVSTDHSVAVLSLRERRCVFFASQHPFPIVAVRWKPCHDFMIVKCFDGSVFVWEMKTGVLDRVLCGVGAEEVVYGCDDVSDDILWDFYTKGLCIEELSRKPLQIVDSKDTGPVQVRGLLSTHFVESFVLFINVSSLIFHLEAIFPALGEEQDISLQLHNLTISPDSTGFHKRLSNVIDAIKQEAGYLQEKFHLSLFQSGAKQSVIPQRKISAASGLQLIPWAQLVMSLLHTWQQDTERDELCSKTLGLLETKTPVSFDLYSSNNVISLRNPSSENLTRNWFEYVGMCALARTLRGLSFSKVSSEVEPSVWEKLVSFNHPNRGPDFLSLEKLAFLWQCSSYTLRSAVRKILPQCLLSLNKTDSLTLLEKWKIFLPRDPNVRDHTLACVAISLVGVLTIDGEIRSQRSDNVVDTCDCIRSAISSSNFNPLIQATAIDILGRGYLIWETALPVDEILILIFDRCSKSNDFVLHSSARDTLKIVARSRLSQFVAFLKLMCKTAHPSLEQSKGEIISVLRGLLMDFPWGLPSLLSDIIEVLLSCIDQGHLKSTELFSLLPGIGKVDQVHHSVNGQRIAVGMPDGKVVVHDLRTHRCHVFLAHSESIRLVRFSTDGKLLVTISSSGAAAVWQLSHGLFDIGVGQFRFKCAKKFEVSVKGSERDCGVDIDWSDIKTINIIAADSEHSTLSTININI